MANTLGAMGTTVMEPVEQGKALTDEISLILSPRNLFGDLSVLGQDERLGGHGTQLPYLRRRLQTVIRGDQRTTMDKRGPK